MTKIVISLDGGGIRGYFQALLLDNLREHKIDLIVGVSAGALNGILFSQNTIKNVDVFSLENSKKICDESCFDKLFGKIQFEPIYDGKGRAEVINKNTSVKRFGDLKIPVAVIAYDVGRVYPKIFKSWEDKDDLTCEIAMATSASPIYFPAHKYKNRWYIDGGVAMNNPATLSYALGKELFPNEEIKVLSIGNGDRPDVNIDKDISKWGSIQWITGGLFSIFVNSASQYTDEVCQILLGKNYLRIEDDKIGEIQLDDTSSTSREKIFTAFQKVWKERGKEIEDFIK